jgi:predicted transcriptional regulator YdeE
MSPEEIRSLSAKGRMQLFKLRKQDSIQHIATGRENQGLPMDIQIKKVESTKGFYLTAPCDDLSKIQESFKAINKIARANDLVFDNGRVYGILSPHQGNIYKTFIAIDKQVLPRNFKVTTIKAGKYVSYKVSGGMEENVRVGHFLF